MKKAPYLKTLYLQKPLVLILLIAALATLPWLGVSTILSGSEQAEFNLIHSFLKAGDLSLLNSNEAHSTISRLLVVGFASFTGELTPYALRLPSALSFIALMGFCFMFFAHRRPVLESFTSVLILITSFGLFASSSVANAYILPSFLIVAGIFEMYRWLESRRKWKLVTTWLFWGTAVFELGWLVLIAPFAAFLVYLLVRKRRVLNIVVEPLLMAVPALLFGLLLYSILPHPVESTFFHNLFAYRSLSSGESWDSFTFAGKILAPFWGFMPWSLLLLVALLAAPFIEKSKEEQAYNYPPVLPLDKVSQYNLLAALVPFVGFLLSPSSVLSEVFFIVSLLFTAIFLSRLAVHLSDMYPLVVRIFSFGLTLVSLVILFLGTLILIKWNEHQSVLDFFLGNQSYAGNVSLVKVESSKWGVDLFLLLALLAATVVNIWFLFRRKNLKVLMATVAMIYAMQLFVNIHILSDCYKKRDGSASQIVATMKKAEPSEDCRSVN